MANPEIKITKHLIECEKRDLEVKKQWVEESRTKVEALENHLKRIEQNQ